MDLDRWIAENVMGWVPHGDWCYENHPDNVLILSSDWHPTRNIQQAFEVVEKMREDGYGFALELPMSGGCYAEFWKESNYDTVTFKAEHNDTPTLAICEAAKKAMEG